MENFLEKADFQKGRFLFKGPEDLRAWISLLEVYLLTLPQVELELKHLFGRGTYSRTMALRKGTLIVGKIHKFENLNFLTKGEVTVLSIEGAIRMKAPFQFVGMAGTKRVIFAHEDSEWTVVCATEARDPESAEADVIAKSYDELKEETCLLPSPQS